MSISFSLTARTVLVRNEFVKRWTTIFTRSHAVPIEETVRAFSFVINQGWVGDADNYLTW